MKTIFIKIKLPTGPCFQWWVGLLWLCVFCFASLGKAQTPNQDSIKPSIKFLSLEPAPHFDKRRFWTVTGAGAGTYTIISTALWKAWYQDYPLTHFHLFDDMGEWNQMDKAGHLFSTWTACKYSFEGARWTGMSRRNAMWTSVGVGMGILSTIETMDGFSEKWGFSVYDMGFNLLGAGLFATQEMLWQSQRIQFKVSGIRPGYPEEPLYSTDGTEITSLDERAAGLYGTSFFHVLLKDYNALTVWATVNVHDFLGEKAQGKYPPWLNLALGYGAGNLYGGFDNKWESEDGVVFELDPVRYPRHRQFYLSMDFDLTKIKTRHRWLRTSFKLLSFLKLPAPALEVNTLGNTRFHWLHW